MSSEAPHPNRFSSQVTKRTTNPIRPLSLEDFAQMLLLGDGDLFCFFVMAHLAQDFNELLPRLRLESYLEMFLWLSIQRLLAEMFRWLCLEPVQTSAPRYRGFAVETAVSEAVEIEIRMATFVLFIFVFGQRFHIVRQHADMGMLKTYVAAADMFEFLKVEAAVYPRTVHASMRSWTNSPF